MMAAWRVAVRVAAPVGWAAPSREPEALAPAAARAPATLALTPPSRIPATTLAPAAAQVEATLALTLPSRIPETLPPAAAAQAEARAARPAQVEAPLVPTRA